MPPFTYPLLQTFHLPICLSVWRLVWSPIQSLSSLKMPTIPSQLPRAEDACSRGSKFEFQAMSFPFLWPSAPATLILRPHTPSPQTPWPFPHLFSLVTPLPLYPDFAAWISKFIGKDSQANIEGLARKKGFWGAQSFSLLLPLFTCNKKML